MKISIVSPEFPESSERGAARPTEPQAQRANCEDGGSAEPVYLLRGVRGRLSRLRVGKFPRMPPVEREPRAAERSGELVELGKSDTETET
jgi:hypothetical protein